MNLELLKRGLGAQRRGALIWGAALLFLTGTVLAVWPSMSDSGSLDSLVSGMPPELIAALGLESLASPAGFLNGNLFALLLPLLLGALGIMHMASLAAGDEDAGRLELLLALPVSRVSVYLSRFASVVIVLAAVALLVGATIVVSAAALEMELDSVGVIAASTSVLLLALFHAALALALSGIGLRSGVVLGATFGVLILGYLIQAFVPMVASISDLVAISPWHWALGEAPLENGFDLGGSALLILGTLVLLAVGLVTIRGRTIRTA